LEVAFATVKPGKEALLLAEGIVKMQPMVGRNGGELQAGLRILAAFADKEAPAFQAMHLLRWAGEAEAKKGGEDAELKALRAGLDGGDSSMRLILHPARFHPEKGHYDLFEAMALIKREGRLNTRLLLAGTGPARLALEGKGRIYVGPMRAAAR